MEITKCPEKEPQQYEKPGRVVPKGMEGRKLRILGYQPDPYQGPVQFQVRVNDKVSKPHAVTLPRIPSRPCFSSALAGFVGLAWFIVRVVLWKGVGYHDIQGKMYGRKLIFPAQDRQDTYSLSKLQLAGSGRSVDVFGDLYLFLCRVLDPIEFPVAIHPRWTDASVGLQAQGHVDTGCVERHYDKLRLEGFRRRSPVTCRFHQAAAAWWSANDSNFVSGPWEGALGFLFLYAGPIPPLDRVTESA